MANHRSPHSPSTPPAPRSPRPSLSASFAPSFGGAALAAPGLPGPLPVAGSLAPRARRADTPPARPSATGGLRPGRLAAAAVAAGALAAAAPGLAGLNSADAPTAELTASTLASAATPARPAPAGPDAATSGVLPAVPNAQAAAAHAPALAKAGQRAAKARPAVAAPRFVKPAQGTFTSGFGARWGASHQGIDLANAIGTPIVSVADGVVTAAGPASGFGQWVKVRLADGTETVYGHVNRFFVHTGEKVSAGERIAEIGNKGESTGPHLHFEVHTPSGKKINPVPWLAERGISVGSQQD